MFVLTIIANSVYMKRIIKNEEADFDKAVKHFQIIKWVIFILIMIAIAATGAEVVSISIN